MKHPPLFIMALACATSLYTATAQQQPDPYASSPPLHGKAVFPEMEYDAGTVLTTDGFVEHNYALTNQGNEPMYVLSVHTGCGCTTTTYDTTAIVPGDTTAIHVRVDLGGRTGEFNHPIYVRTTGHHRPVRLMFNVTVVEPEPKP